MSLRLEYRDDTGRNGKIHLGKSLASALLLLYMRPGNYVSKRKLGSRKRHDDRLVKATGDWAIDVLSCLLSKANHSKRWRIFYSPPARINSI